MKAETDARTRLINDTSNLLAQATTDMDEAWWASTNLDDETLLDIRRDAALWEARKEWDRVTRRLLGLLDTIANEDEEGDNND